MKKSIIIWVVAIILVVTAVYTTYQYNNRPDPAPAPNASVQPEESAEEILDSIPAIDFTLKDLNGKEVSLSDYKGKKIFVNFWASWCGPCVREMPYIEQLYKENTDSDLIILTVNLQEKSDVVSKFMNDKGHTFPVMMDAEGEVGSIYGIRSIPLSLLIDKDFNIISAHEGAVDSYKTLMEFVNQ